LRRFFCQKSYEREKNDIKVGKIIKNDQFLKRGVKKFKKAKRKLQKTIDRRGRIWYTTRVKRSRVFRSHPVASAQSAVNKLFGFARSVLVAEAVAFRIFYFILHLEVLNY